MQTEIPTQIDAYFEQNLLKTDPVLDKIAQSSSKNGLVPHAVTRLQAEFLSLLIRMSRAESVLEIGCLGGYSAVAMARALPETGKVLTTEIDTRTAEIAQGNIDGSGFGQRIDAFVAGLGEGRHLLVTHGGVIRYLLRRAGRDEHVPAGGTVVLEVGVNSG